MMVTRLSRQKGRRYGSFRDGMSMIRSLAVRGTTAAVVNAQQLLMFFGVGN